MVPDDPLESGGNCEYNIAIALPEGPPPPEPDIEPDVDPMLPPLPLPLLAVSPELDVEDELPPLPPPFTSLPHADATRARAPRTAETKPMPRAPDT